eukprot:CAMPEP_0194138706 /NCGR_PEP_ID=MMETSP0152-20130528/8442_1 /TAXON_ID=1049557 /ORGANISM="Thalassiothrix antarctica, Strain L6-D1" /LENGTH=277 /DNA_ID=CAMNT_0038836231 /DNA_START=138 /DNA_END=971 /DNA_ORIENTATION=+
MSLTNQTVWVVGGVGVVGRGITRGLLQLGATVIVNSRSADRLQQLQETLDYPEKLATVHGSLLPGKASYTAGRTIERTPLNHVVAHGAVRWWARPTPGVYDNIYEYKAGCDETYSLNIKADETLLNMRIEEFGINSSQLASLHLSAAQNLIPRLTGSNPTYTFVTGGSGRPGSERAAMGEINSHQVWGLSHAMRHELKDSRIICREIRVGLPVHEYEKNNEPVSEHIGDICAGLVSYPKDQGRLIKLDEFEDIENIMNEYEIKSNDQEKDLPHLMCE